MNRQRNILVKINEISTEDLYLIEQDLSFQEKASIAFLLFGDNKTNAEVMLQKLLVSYSNNDNRTDILEHFSRYRPEDWKVYLVEALAIVRANKVIRKLGLNLSEVKTYFLPHIKEINMHINQLLKVLYVICDQLTPIEAADLVLKVQTNLDSRNHLRFYSFHHLEVFFLNWIAQGKLTISDEYTTDVSLLAFYFKDNKMSSFLDMLSGVAKKTISCSRDLVQNSSVNSEMPESAVSDVSGIQTLAICGPSTTINESYHYKISREAAGFALIINQRTFTYSTDPSLKDLLPKSPLKSRQGTDFDRDRLSRTFSSRGYKPIIKDDLNHVEILKEIREVVHRSLIYHSVVICILSHGENGCVFGADSVRVQISDIKDILTFKEIENKPKMLFIQACQGDTIQRREEEVEFDGGGKDSRNYFDMLIANSTIPGYASLRNPKSGSWFIQTLCDQIDELGDHDDIMGILTAVNNAIDKRNDGSGVRMTPMTSSTLKKKLRLPSRMVS